jgi:hypothetical protein
LLHIYEKEEAADVLWRAFALRSENTDVVAPTGSY